MVRYITPTLVLDLIAPNWWVKVVTLLRKRWCLLGESVFSVCLLTIWILRRSIARIQLDYGVARPALQKTQKPLNVPLSGEALKVLEEKKNPDEPIFKLPTSDATINYHIKKWVKNGHIDKTISFHCSRHTFATMMLTLGADLYTTSKLLGHANVTTTQIYSKIIDKKKTEAVSLVDELFTQQSKEAHGEESEN